MDSTLQAAIVGGVFALLGVMVGSWYSTRLGARHDRRSLAGAFAGEIQAIVDIFQRRRYLEGIEDLIAEVQRTGRPTAVLTRIRGSYFQVFQANAGRIGVLRPPLPREIAGFYTKAFALLEDIRDPAEADNLGLTAEESLELLTEMRDLLKDLLESGRECVRIAESAGRQ